MITRTYPEMTVSQSLGPDKELLKRLEEEEYNLVIVHEQPEDLFCWKRCGTEKLFIAMPVTNPLAGHKGIWLKDLEGVSILLFSQIGFWHDLCLEKIPHPRFLMQDDFNTFGELAFASALPPRPGAAFRSGNPIHRRPGSPQPSSSQRKLRS